MLSFPVTITGRKTDSEITQLAAQTGLTIEQTQTAVQQAYNLKHQGNLAFATELLTRANTLPLAQQAEFYKKYPWMQKIQATMKAAGVQGSDFLQILKFVQIGTGKNTKALDKFISQGL